MTVYIVTIQYPSAHKVVASDCTWTSRVSAEAYRESLDGIYAGVAEVVLHEIDL
jgi:hypothetical protein